MKVAITNHHGLGDTVMLTAALRRYFEIHPYDEIHLFTLSRFGKTSIDLLKDIPYIKKVHPILPDLWNDFTSFQEGIGKIVDRSYEYGRQLDIDTVIPTFCFRYENQFSFYNNKNFRFAYDLGVNYTNPTQFKPDIVVSPEERKKVQEYLSNYQRPYKLLHLQGGNKLKTLGYGQIPFPYDWTEGTTFEIGENLSSQFKQHIPIGIPDVNFTKALVEACDTIVAIDSFIMHLAFALEKQTIALFTSTPAIQVVPLWKDYSSFVTFHCNPPTWGNGLDLIKKVEWI